MSVNENNETQASEPAIRTLPGSTPAIAAQGAEAGDFRVTSPPEVLALLRQMFEGQTRVTLTGPTGAQLNTRLCAVDPDHGAIGFDVLPRDPQVHALLGADEATASAYLDMIRVAFDLEGLVLVNGGSGSVLRSAYPAVLMRFQRRQAFRVKPNTRTPQARLLLAGAEGAEQHLRIVDLSVGGVALLLPPGPVPAPELGSEFEAQLELDRESRFRALLRLQHVSSLSGDAAAGAGGTKLGFAWAAIDPVALRHVQLFIDQTQKLNRLLRKS